MTAQKDNEIDKLTEGYDFEQLKATQEANKYRFQDRRTQRLNKAIENWQPNEFEIIPAKKRMVIQPSEAKKAMYSCLCLAAGKKNLEFTEHNAHLINAIIHYLCDFDRDIGPFQTSYDCPYDSVCKCTRLDPNKGLYICGDYGRGKTTLINAIMRFLNLGSKRYDNLKKVAHRYDYKSLVDRAMKDMNTAFQYQNKGLVIFDDLGFMGESQLRIWGKEVDLIRDIIYKRHRTWSTDPSKKTFFTSNLMYDDIKQNHEEGVSSRLYQMCNIIVLDGENFRLI